MSGRDTAPAASYLLVVEGVRMMGAPWTAAQDLSP